MNTKKLKRNLYDIKLQYIYKKSNYQNINNVI